MALQLHKQTCEHLESYLVHLGTYSSFCSELPGLLHAAATMQLASKAGEQTMTIKDTEVDFDRYPENCNSSRVCSHDSRVSEYLVGRS